MDVDKKAIVIGGGLSGCVAARELAEAGYKVTIIEKRNHVGGNLYDSIDSKTGITYHNYGPHVFHTNKKEIYNYFCKYVEVEPYKIKCTSIIKGKEVPCPFNFETIDRFYEPTYGKTLKNKLFEKFGEKTTILQLLESQDDDIKQYGEFLFEHDYKPYTIKQWGLHPDNVDKKVLRRVPVYFNYSDYYFDDNYQCLPKTSYRDFFTNILNHKNINIVMNCNGLKGISFSENEVLYEEKHCLVVYTGMIDTLFSYKFGFLPYRSLKFVIKRFNVPSYQDGAMCALPSLKYKCTRRTEYSKIPLQSKGKTLVVYEYSYLCNNNNGDEGFYPIHNELSNELFKKYMDAASNYKNLIICGRLGLYKYQNMDEVIYNTLLLINGYLGR